MDYVKEIFMIRKSTRCDAEKIMKLIEQAQHYFQKEHIDQWQNGYPHIDHIFNDIEKGNSYVLENERILATMYFAFENDPCYCTIKGKWLTQNQPYAVIHRIVVDENYKGQNVAYQMLNFAIKSCQDHHIGSIRIDTHQDNLSMQRFLCKHGFHQCGHITLEDGSDRIAFEKIIE